MSKKFIEIGSEEGTRTYRVTFKCSMSEYSEVLDYIIGYGEILFEEVEVEE